MPAGRFVLKWIGDYSTLSTFKKEFTLSKQYYKAYATAKEYHNTH